MVVLNFYQMEILLQQEQILLYIIQIHYKLEIIILLDLIQIQVFIRIK